MRTVFSIDLKVDIDSDDEATAGVYIDLCKQTAQQLFSQAAMLTSGKRAPEIGVRTIDSQHGQREIELFTAPKG